MITRIEKVTGIFASCLLFLLMLLTFVDVFGRNILNRPLPGASEITEILLACVIFLMLPQVALRKQHIVIDLIDAISNRTMRLVQDIFGALLSAAMFFLVGWQLWVLAGKAAGYADATPTLQIPLGPVLFGIAVLSFINGLAFLVTIPMVLRRPEPAPASKAEELPFSV